MLPYSENRRSSIDVRLITPECRSTGPQDVHCLCLGLFPCCGRRTAFLRSAPQALGCRSWPLRLPVLGVRGFIGACVVETAEIELRQRSSDLLCSDWPSHHPRQAGESVMILTVVGWPSLSQLLRLSSQQCSFSLDAYRLRSGVATLVGRSHW